MVDYYERRSPNPTLEVMQKIAAVLEISVVVRQVASLAFFQISVFCLLSGILRVS